MQMEKKWRSSMMQTTIDVSGLPESIVNGLRQLVDSLRERQGKNSTAPPNETPEEWAQRFMAWVESHPKRSIEFDDSRESIYSGRGE
jgi:hypothetical protein